MLHRNIAGEETSLVINPFEQTRSAITFIGPKHGREWPYPGQLWRHEHIQVTVVAGSPDTVSYEDLRGPFQPHASDRERGGLPRHLPQDETLSGPRGPVQRFRASQKPGTQQARRRTMNADALTRCSLRLEHIA